MGSRVNGEKMYAKKGTRFRIHRNIQRVYLLATKKKKELYLLNARLEVRRESDNFRSIERDSNLFLSFLFFFRRPIALFEMYSFFFFSFLSFNNRNGRHPEINVSLERGGGVKTRVHLL